MRLSGPKILRGEPTTPRLGPVAEGDVFLLWPLLVTAGIVLAVAGWADVALFWYPPRFGEADWEFGIISQTYDALPLGTLGLTLLAGGLLIRGGQVWMVRAVGVAFLVLAVLSLGCVVIYALDLPQAWRALANPQIAPGLKRAIAKTALFLVSYTAAYTVMGLFLWRRRGEPT